MKRFSTLAESASKAGRQARAAVKAAETELLAAEGRRSVKAKARTTVKVTKKAAKTGAIAGALVATAVVVREIRKRRKLSG